MKRLAIVAFVALVALVPGTALADSHTLTLTSKQLRNIIMGTFNPTIPPEWAGIWSVQDSIYNCQGQSTDVSTTLDTLCAGAVLADPGESPITFDCVGFANATTFSQTCTGSGDVAGCHVDFHLDSHGTRTNDSYYSVSVIQFTYSGPSPCDLFPGQCNQTNSHGTRTDPEPAQFCSTPTRESTWGDVKIHYR
jgi:hypothetical protein